MNFPQHEHLRRKNTESNRSLKPWSPFYIGSTDALLQPKGREYHGLFYFLKRKRKKKLLSVAVLFLSTVSDARERRLSVFDSRTTSYTTFR